MSSYIVGACIEHNIDVLILTEYSNVDIQYIQRKLNIEGKSFIVEQIDKNSRILLMRNSNVNLKVINEGKQYYSIFKLIAGNQTILIFAVHFPSLTNLERNDIDMFSSQIAREFEQFEEKYETEDSLIVGDFNMNPFDPGMVSSFSFNAVMCPEIAKKKDRTFLFNERKFYYNPMWHVMGNESYINKGTYFYAQSAKSYYWYTYDQVLIRPGLIKQFSMPELEALNCINDNNLLTKKGITNSEQFSDHLPLKFEIKMEGK